MGSDVAAMTDLCRLAEWKTRTKDYLPEDRHSEFAGVRIDRYAVPLKNRWIYALVQVRSVLKAFSVPFEAYVDEHGLAWFIGDTDPARLTIAKRPDPREHGESSSHVQFPLVNHAGEALKTRLLCSPFRLPAQALVSINERNYHRSIRKMIPPLWEWKDAAQAPSSPVVSSDGWALVINPMWLTFPGEASPSTVLVGSDPFQIAKNKSDIFVKKRRAYANKFEPTTGFNVREVDRINFARSLTNLLLSSDAGKEGYAGVLDVARMNKDVAKFEDDQRKALAKVNQAVRKLCKFLRSPVFSFVQYSSMHEEGYDDVLEYSEAVVKHIETLDVVIRQLHNTKDGVELMLRWAKEAQDSQEHFLGQIVDPSHQTPVHVFRSFRWAGKSLLSVHGNLLPFLSDSKNTVLSRLGVIFEKYGVIPLASKLVDMAQDKVVDFANMFDLADVKPSKSTKVKVKLLGKDFKKAVMKFAEEGSDLAAHFPKELRTRKFLGVFLLDVANVALSIEAMIEAEGTEAFLRATAGGGAAIGFLASSMYQPVVDAMAKFKPNGELNLKKVSRLRAIRGVQAACSVIYGTLDFIAAAEAFEKDDNDRAAALLIAGTSEMATALVLMRLVMTGGAATGVLAILGIIASLAYIAAMFLQDDPLKEFLKNCEWGSERYGDPSYHPPWVEAPVSEWADSIEMQSRIFVRLLSRLTVKWSLDASEGVVWPSVNVTTSLCRTGFRLRVDFEATYADGSTQTKRAIYDPGDMPQQPPLKLGFDPDEEYTSAKHAGIRNVWCRVYYRSQFNAREEKLEALLMEDGKGNTSGTVKRVNS